MNKHFIIRSLSVLLIVSALFILSQINFSFINSCRLDDISVNQFHWHPKQIIESEKKLLKLDNEMLVQVELIRDNENLSKLEIATSDNIYQRIDIEQNIIVIEKLKGVFPFH